MAWGKANDVCLRCGGVRSGHERSNADSIAYLCPNGSGYSMFDNFEPGAKVEGVGASAPTVVNAAGGKQSDSPYRADLLPPLALLAVARVLKHGADKYGSRNWHRIAVADHINHAMVHLLAAGAGDTSDDHLDHAACRILFALDSHLAGRDDAARKAVVA